MTSHSSQGQTFSKGAAVDLCIGGSSSTMSSYVALTRVERRQDLLILRPFPLDLFTKGQKPGMQLLLRTLRGDKSIDWKAIEKELMPSKLCPTCGSVKLKTSFTETEFKRLDEKKINWSALANCVKQKRRQKAFLCSAHIVLHIVPKQTSHRKKGIGKQALNEFVVGVILGKFVVYVRSCGTDNISQIENGCV